MPSSEKNLDRKIWLKSAYEDAYEKGIEKGIEEGKYAEKAKFAILSLENGISIETVSKITGMSIEELKVLQG